MLCAHIVFSSDDRKMMERMYAPQKSEFYKSMLFVHLRQVNLLKNNFKFYCSYSKFAFIKFVSIFLNIKLFHLTSR